MLNEENHSADELITRHLAGETSAAEERELASWIGLREENNRHYQAMKKAFGLASQHLAGYDSPGPDIDVDVEWQRFRSAAGVGAPRQHPGSRVWLRIAASVLLLLATGGILYYFTSPRDTVYQTAAATETVTLPDGSQVTLNQFTELAFAPGFGELNRTVTLKGEAFFEVEPDAERPFIIHTEKAVVQVVGTSFNVNAYDSMAMVEVVVRTGIVSLQAAGSDQRVRLEAGQKGVYNKAGKKVAATVNTDVNFLSWNTQRIVFVENDLRTVIETLKKTYHADITLATEIPETCIVTVTFDQQSLEAVMRVLENTLNLKYTLKGNKVEITEAGC